MSAPTRPEPGPEPDPGPPAEILGGGSAEPRLGERWTALPPRSRRLAATGAGLAALAALGAYVLATRPEPEPPAPVPYPIQSTDFSFLGIETPKTGDTAFDAQLIATSDSGASLEKITQGYGGLKLSARPPLPLRLPEGQPIRVTVRFEVTECAGLPLDASLPSLRVTLRNTRAIQDYSSILGATYAAELSRALRTICEPAPRAAPGA
ncbi:hypothetical protein O7599_31375 [Streptomyces sp. WMMC500]|uniref:hypothetical protein n=1 Tax=Streptomyces sp. WMMC500 TaxID=3015154 RepID=UPI00248B7369|nr:hypothetical protein [Streptomyces sp. WMMC500]WBB60000.1 hypothetical protein O7599_31375 [Streptomyces sp. WMMC500]